MLKTSSIGIKLNVVSQILEYNKQLLMGELSLMQDEKWTIFKGTNMCVSSRGKTGKIGMIEILLPNFMNCRNVVG